MSATIVNITPSYWIRTGGAHLTLEIPHTGVSVLVAAVRSGGGRSWCLNVGDDIIRLPADMTEEQVRERMLVEARRALVDVLNSL